MYLSNFLELINSYGTNEDHHGEFTLGKSLAFTWFSLTLKGWITTPTKLSARIVFFR